MRYDCPFRSKRPISIWLLSGEISPCIKITVIGLFIAVAYFGDTKAEESFSLAGDQFHILARINRFGANEVPRLSWANPPSGTASFAITLHRVDSRTGERTWHWIAFNIPADCRFIGADSRHNQPDSLRTSAQPERIVESNTDFGDPGFVGVCSRIGEKPQEYVFTIYALNVSKLGLPSATVPAQAELVINRHVVEKATMSFFLSRESIPEMMGIGDYN